MFKLFFISLLLLFTIGSKAQNPKTSSKVDRYEYYIRLSGIYSRQQVTNLQALIGNRKGISFFMANRYPVRYFLMRSDRNITTGEFRQWLAGSTYTVDYYGEGTLARQKAVLLYNEDKKKSK